MPRRARNVYLPLDVEFFDNEKVLTAGERAGWLYIAMCCRAKRLLTDGILSEQQIDRLSIPGWRRRLSDLLRVGLVLPTDDGRYLIVGFLERNLSAEQVEQVREKDRKRKGFQTDSERNPDGIPTDPREEKRSSERREGSSRHPAEVCPHGAEPISHCFTCRKAVGQ
jgi:hypothetical protein